jgi:hypothetical protein
MTMKKERSGRMKHAIFTESLITRGKAKNRRSRKVAFSDRRLLEHLECGSRQ